ncbi:MAG: translation initiation factor IF-3 [Deltaproteobacteria bacterium]|nr:translation initiation factor IF-3 [Deltaproteobacteria bacterium]
MDSRHRSNEPRVNRRIRVPEVRVVLDNGEQLGVLATQEALRRAESMSLDLVEVSPMAKPPVCKIMDYGKFKYQQKRKANEAKKKQQTIELKEVKFRPKTDIHDFEVKVNRLKGFIKDGNKGKVTIMFRGREIVHPEIGFNILKRVMEYLGEEASVESPAKMEGRQMVMIVGPQKKK